MERLGFQELGSGRGPIEANRLDQMAIEHIQYGLNVRRGRSFKCSLVDLSLFYSIDPHSLYRHGLLQ